MVESPVRHVAGHRVDVIQSAHGEGVVCGGGDGSLNEFAETCYTGCVCGGHVRVTIGPENHLGIRVEVEMDDGIDGE